MRDGRDGFSIYFKVPPAGSVTVPVPEKITENEYSSLMGPTSGRVDGAQLTFNSRRDTLTAQGAVSFDSGLTETKFAETLVGPRPPDDDAQALAQWKTLVEQERKSLHNAHGKKSYRGVLCDQRFPTGGDRLEWRWFIVNPVAADSAAGPGVGLDAVAVFAGMDRPGELQSTVGLAG
jgi:hypothetical protein